MFRQFYKTCLPVLLVIVFFCCVVFSPQDGFAQSFFKVTDKIGGSGSSTGQSQDTGDNSTTLIIVGAAVIAGFLVYKLVLDKDNPVKNIKKDTTSSDESLLFRNNNKSINDKELEFEKYQQQPVKFYAGIQKPDILIPERRLIFGITYNF